MNAPLNSSTSGHRRLGRYRLLLPLGQGAAGDVWLALQPGPFGFRKLVVVKELRSELVGSSESRAMFLDEARLAARLNHPNVVQVLEVGEDHGSYFLAMEYLEGASLQAVRERQPAPPLMEVRALTDVLAGLQYAHDLCDFDSSPLGIIHRDMSPDNVFISAHGATKILDFGIAKAKTSSTRTGVDQVKGKIAYMSPEQVRGEKLDQRTDVFSVGIMLWEALAQRRIWAGESDVSIMYRLSHHHIPSIEPFVPPEATMLVPVVTRALAPERADRYPTAQAFRTELVDALRSTGKAETGPTIAGYVADLFADTLEGHRRQVEEELKKTDDDTHPDRAHRMSTGSNDEPRYAIDALFHQGSAAVFSGHDQRLDISVVLKRFALQFEQVELRRRLEGVTRLLSPNTAQILDAGAINTPQPNVFIVRAFVEGRTLAEVLRTGPLALDDACSIAMQIAGSLAEAHGLGVVHGRLCPEHVIVHRSHGRCRATVIDYEGLTLGLPRPPAAASFAAPGAVATTEADVQGAALMLYVMLGGSWTVDVWQARQWAALPRPARRLQGPTERALAGEVTTGEGWLTLLREATKTPTNTSTSTSNLRPLRLLATSRFEMLADQSATVWVLADGPGLSSPELEPAWSLLASTYEVVRLPPGEREGALNGLTSGATRLPWMIIFGDLHVLVNEPVLTYLMPTMEVGRLLVSTHPNYELLESSINVCGLDGHVCAPVDPDALLERVTDVLTLVRARRLRFDRLRQQVRAERGWIAAHAREETRD